MPGAKFGCCAFLEGIGEGVLGMERVPFNPFCAHVSTWCSGTLLPVPILAVTSAVSKLLSLMSNVLLPTEFVIMVLAGEVLAGVLMLGSELGPSLGLVRAVPEPDSGTVLAPEPDF